MAVKALLIFAALLALSRASPARRRYAGITEATASDAPATSGATDWDDDSEDFDIDADDWFSKAAVSPSSVPPKARQDTSEYDDDYSRGNVMVEFGEDDDEEEDEDEQHLQDAEEDDGSRNDSEFLFLPPKDSRLMLEDDDDDQSGPIKVRHTGRSSYQHGSDGGDNSLESMEDDKQVAEEHPYEFTIDQDDKGSDEDDDEDERRAGDSAETSPRHEGHDDDNDDDEDEFVSEGGEDEMFDNPAEESAQVIYGDHVLLY